MAPLLLAAVAASKASCRFGVPALVLFAGLGMLAGEEGPGRVAFNDAGLAQDAGVVSLSVISCLRKDWPRRGSMDRRSCGAGYSGVTVASAFLAGWFACLILGIPLSGGVLLASILTSTDAAAVLTVLATSGISLRARLGPLLELQNSIPQRAGSGLGEALGGFVVEMVLGLLLGLAGGRLGVWALNRLQLSSEGLYGSDGGDCARGFRRRMTAASWPVVRNGASFVHKASVVRFHDRAARPVAVFASLARAKMTGQQKPLVGRVGLRGAVPIVLTSALAQGTIARVGLALLAPIATQTTPMATEIIVNSGALMAGRRIIDLGLPKRALMALVIRDEENVLPRGGHPVHGGRSSALAKN
jgi:potassium/hydrogen antiporter